MVDSDDDFTELCSKLLKRIKKTKPPESQVFPKSSTAIKKKTKSAASRNQTGNGSSKTQQETISAAGVVEKTALPNEKCLIDRTERKKGPGAQSTSLSNGDLRKEPSFCDGASNKTEVIKSLGQPSTKQLVLERMQQFKRVDPARMKLSCEEGCELEDIHSAEVAVSSDHALAQALQIDLSKQQNSLEDEGLFFCQICQKDLTAMNTLLREQHVNRCLDQEESFGGAAENALVPSCPLCGKPFTTEKSRASHLKRCAAKLEVPAQTLLQAVQRQAVENGTEGPAHVQPSRSKRKAGSKQKETTKKRKVAQPGTNVEDLLVAMALSRSLQEDTAAAPLNNGGIQGVLPSKQQPAPVLEKKSRKKQKAGPPPLLLVQAPEVAMQRVQERVGLLLSEEPEVGSIVPLPPSHFHGMVERAPWSHLPRNEKISALWDISNMIENIDSLNYYTEELNPPIIPWKPPQKLMSSQPKVMVAAVPAGTPPCNTSGTKEKGSVGNENLLTHSQRDRQALSDLVELAGEGMTLTQWNLGNSETLDRAERESLGNITPSGFVPSQHEETSKPSNRPQPSAPLMALATDFQEMVNNPHLSDAQLQTDCGEVLSVHMFVLYARCPLMVEAVHSEGFWVDESSSGRVKRLLLNDVSAEAAISFLRFLYTACTDIPSHCLPHVCELARRFGVESLIDTCEQLLSEPLISRQEDIAEEDDAGERAETFQELLKSMWVDEDEEILEDVKVEELEEERLERVGEGELEEIYEFAATQRRIAEDQDTDGGSTSEHDTLQQGVESEDSAVRFNIVKETVPVTGIDFKHLSALQPQDSAINKTVIMASPNQVTTKLSLLDSSSSCPASATSKSNDFSFSVSPSCSSLPSSAVCTMLQTSPAQSIIQSASPSKSTCVNVSPAHQLFVDSSFVPAQTTSPKSLEKCHLQPVQSSTSISPSLGKNAKPDMFARDSPPSLDDSFERMFSETCGEYMEPSGVSESSVTPRYLPDKEDGLSSSPSLTPLASLPELGCSPKFSPKPSRASAQVSQHIKDIQIIEGFTSACLSRKDSSPAQDPSCHQTFSPNSSCLAKSQEQEIILILSSDDDSESSHQVSDLPIYKQENITRIVGVIKESPKSFIERRSSEGHSHLEMSSSTETSWLIPATPLPNKTANSSQFQTSTLIRTAQTSTLFRQAPDHQSPVSPTLASSPLSPPLLSPTTSDKRSISNLSPSTNIASVLEKLPEVHKSSSNVPSTNSLLHVSSSSNTVFEVCDSEDEAPLAQTQLDTNAHTFQMDYEPPIHVDDDLWFNGEETPTRPCSSPMAITSSPSQGTPTKCSENNSRNTPHKRNTQSGRKDDSSHTTASHSSLLNPQLWEEWEEEEDELPAMLPLSERLNKAPEKQKELKTPVSIVRRRELAPKVPITPLPEYSDMDTPVLKKELNRFGVRALPKKQMVLKLKEIFRYTHQTMSSDSEDEVPTSQRQQNVCSDIMQVPKLPTVRRQLPTGSSQALITTDPTTSKISRTKNSSQAQKQKKPVSVSVAARDVNTGGEQPLTASQESTGSSASASDTSLSQSSTSNEFETAFADEDDDDSVAPSQQAGREAATAEAVKLYIEEHPALHKSILLYQPLELAALQTELKQAGIKMAAGKLLDYLDARCVTFTTAAARKEKKSRGRRKGGKRY
ncbi:structure-specific endonuclease subunit SLX4 [Bombina bombina]|uniref:structure-specific endonuclease subunit SLX4 n=1 Tax=Bombina bombina TaxID=8345 RepID=UPI00235A962D|nr:structure-specific endonuclease subunit SLX4 [Bombina bombina]